MIYNICGQPFSGKKTLGNQLKKHIETKKPNRKVFILDPIILKKILKNEDKSQNGHRENISQCYRIAEYLNTTEEFDVIITVTSPFKDLRDELRFTSNAIEVYVHTTNIRGDEKHQIPYFEPPFLDYIDIDTTDRHENVSSYELFNKIQEFIELKR